MFKALRLITMVAVLSILGISNAFAAMCVQNQNKIHLVGLDSSNGIVFAQVTDHNNGCGCNYFRFAPENTDTKMALAVLLAAKTSGITVRIDALAAKNCNSGYRVYLH